ncbi:MAG: RNA polymerase sigma factor [Planctomycetes bacterium]|nr:RNA polymerase sigma factor [Planctomycetota bacterium]
MGAEPTPTDDDLVARCREARRTGSQAFAELYRRHAGAVLGFLFGLHGGDEEGARDALQETFVRFHGALDALERGRPLRPWLYRIARNVSLDQWKRKGRRPEERLEPAALAAAARADGEADPARIAAAREEHGLLRRALDALGEGERAVFLLRHDQGHTYEEIADALGCSVRTAKYRMKAAVERLGREAERQGVVR